MSSLYLTADKVGMESGGGLVTAQEYAALQSLGQCDLCRQPVAYSVYRGDVGATQCLCAACSQSGENPKYGWKEFAIDGCELWDRDRLLGHGNYAPFDSGDPFHWDSAFAGTLDFQHHHRSPKLSHFYAGCFTNTVNWLKERGCKTSYTAAAHSISASKKAHEDLGVPYDYPHLTDPELLKRYLGGYLEADVLICPSQHSAEVMRGLGRTGRIEVIPHGCTLPEKVAPLPERFTVGALGAIGGPDKGLRYLLEAWKRLDYKDATLVLGGSHSQTPWVQHLVNTFFQPECWGTCHYWRNGERERCPAATRLSGAQVRLLGWVPSVSDFYDNISLLVQPSVSEGFGCEVTEALAHSRPVACSTGAGAADVLPMGPNGRRLFTFPAGDVGALMEEIAHFKKAHSVQGVPNPAWREIAKQYEWPRIRARYVDVWRSLL